MPVFQLDEKVQFPRPELAEDNGLLAIGGDLSPQRLITGYSLGIFPWYTKDGPLLWWFTSPRLVIFPHEFRIPKRLARYSRTNNYEITRNQAFSQVINECATIDRKGEVDTWITDEMQIAYNKLHRLGYAHSIECWQENNLVGGIYGIGLGKIFFGESMFSRIKCGSQFALIGLVDYLKSSGCQMIDCQMTTDHLLRFGAREIEGMEFQQILQTNITNLNPCEKWKNESY